MHGINWDICIVSFTRSINFFKENYQKKSLVYFSGQKCGTLGIPPVYTRVANFLPWIQSKLGNDQCKCAPKNDGEKCVYNKKTTV